MKKSFVAALFLLTIGFSTVRANESIIVFHGKPMIIHNILSDSLPPSLLSVIKTDYKDYWITDLFEEDGKNLSYTITLENPDQIIIMTSTDSQHWVITKTTIKDL